MRRAWLLAMLVGLSLPALSSAADPVLRSATVSRGHVVATFSLGDLAPGVIVVSTSRRLDANGALSRAGVRLRERLPIRPVPRSRVVVYRTRRALAPGVYFVQLSGVDLGGTLDCAKPGPGCGSEWSNVMRVVVAPG